MRQHATPPHVHRALALAALLLGAGCLNHHEVVPGSLHRSAQPAPGEFGALLDRHGIRTVLLLRGSRPGDADFAATAAPVAARGLDLVQIPLSSRHYPSRAQLARIWEVLETAERPLWVHCMGGADRTGLVCALDELRRSGDPDRARAQFRFVPYRHTGLRGAWRQPDIIDRYARHAGSLSFPEWLRIAYEPTAFR